MLATRTVPPGRMKVPLRPRHHRRAWIIAAGLIGLLSTPLPAGSQSADALHEQAMQLYKAGRYADALPLFQRALTQRESELGPDHPDTALALTNLAQLYWAQGQYAQALPLLQRALAIREKALGPEHVDTGQSLHNLARTHHALGQHAEAMAYYQRSLAIREKALGPEHPDTAASAQQYGGALLGPGPVSRRPWRTARARARHPRESARPRASRHGAEPEQPGVALPDTGPVSSGPGARTSAHSPFAKKCWGLSMRIPPRA